MTVLARLQNWSFWYPALVLWIPQTPKQQQKVSVRFWRGCEFFGSYKDDLPESLTTTVPFSLIRDSLWGDAKERRQIRVRRYAERLQGMTRLTAFA